LLKVKYPHSKKQLPKEPCYELKMPLETTSHLFNGALSEKYSITQGKL